MIPGTLAVIPARIGSSRLARKPLVQLAGRPLIQWVWERVADAGIFSEVVIATDSEEVRAAALDFGARVEITNPQHPSGTDRIAEVAVRAEFAAYSTIINVQGDEPFVRPEQMRAALDLVVGDGWEIGTVATPVRSPDEWRDPGIVKVVRDSAGGALLFSRAPIPFPRDSERPDADDLESGFFLRHLGVYSYTREALLRWVGLPEAPLERIEKLEQLRPLAAGMRIGVALVEPSEAGVDSPADLARAESRLHNELLSRPQTTSV